MGGMYMAWKISKQEQTYRKETYFGECPRFHKKAEITGHYIGTKWAKSDLQLTYRLSGYACSLLAGNGEDGICPFAEECPVIPPKYL